MFQNYLKIALRHLARNRGYTVINILGLAIGIACTLIILMYVQDELSFDQWHEDGDQIYRMALERKYPGRSRHYAIIPQSYSETVKSEYPEVENAVRMFSFQGTLNIKIGETIYEEENRVWADSNWFEFFSLPLIQGKVNEVLTQPNSVVLTETTAKKYFGEENPMGKTLDIPQNPVDLIVTGICADVPENSHFTFDLMMSSANLQFLQQPNYLNFSAYTYLHLSPNASPATLESKFPDLVTKYASGQVMTQFGVNYEEYQKQGNGYRYFLQPLKDIYLTSKLEAELKPPGSRLRVYFFMVIAVLILMIACINFMNLATARSGERAREVGIRKTLGSERIDIALQFLLEAVSISLISTVLAWGILQYFIPIFNELAGKNFSTAQITNWQYIPGLLGFGVLVGLFAGAYPSIVLSSFKPLEVLRGRFGVSRQGFSLRNVLVVFQFFISIALIICTIVVFRQMEFIQNKELGFTKEHLITLQGAGGMTAQQEDTFKKEMVSLSGVESIGGCNSQPGGNYFGMSFQPQGAIEMTTGSGLIVDEDYLDCMKMEVIEGRSFSIDFMDTLSIIVNEAAVKEMELKDPVGKQLVSNDNFLNPNPEQRSVYTIVGVVKDFHFQSLHQVISPLFFVHKQRSFTPGVNNLLTVRLKPGNFKESISQIGGLWKQFQPEQPFRYTFLDRDWAELYENEQKAQRVFGLFSMLAILIACMGLLGLAAYVTQQRTKEIGVRKVMGATVPNIVAMLSKDFLKLVLIALIIASPVAWYVMQHWFLEDFVYRINIAWWMFALAGVLAILIAFFTVSYQSIRAALMNPINSLRDE